MYDTSEARGEDEDNDADDNDDADDDDDDADDADDAVDKNLALMVVEVVVAAARCGRAQGKELGASCKAKQPKELQASWQQAKYRANMIYDDIQ